jgi:hypothetical protein
MKKVLVLLLVLLGTTALFAADPAFTPKIGLSGHATATFGVNLDTGATGFTNETLSDFNLELVPSVDPEKGGKEGEAVYGYIKLAGIGLNIDRAPKTWDTKTDVNGDGKIDDADVYLVNSYKDGDFANDTDYPLVAQFNAPDITAKLFLGPVYINVRGDGPRSEKAGGDDKDMIGISVLHKDNGDAWFMYTLTPITGANLAAAQVNDTNVGFVGKSTTGVNANGIYVGLTDTSVVDVKIGVGSKKSYMETVAGDRSSNEKQDYSFWGQVDLTAVPNLIASVKANYAMNQTDRVVLTLNGAPLGDANAGSTAGVGVDVGYKIAIDEKIAVTPEAAFDLNTAGNWRASAGVGVTLPGTKKDDWTA